MEYVIQTWIKITEDWAYSIGCSFWQDFFLWMSTGNTFSYLTDYSCKKNVKVEEKSFNPKWIIITVAAWKKVNLG